ncbi:unnamed protein product [Caenorhabditis sp. 36 PRJEB53466]|nr:unnamed protein product [Caenorhabditis sp. 36 PRJEB53466]
MIYNSPVDNILKRLSVHEDVSFAFSERHGVPAVDFKLECQNIPHDVSVTTGISFRNCITGRKERFFFVFDAQRNTYCYRRIATGIRHVREDGVTIVSFPIDRFLKAEEEGEVFESVEQKKWPLYVPFTWKVLENGEVEAGAMKRCFYGHEFRLTIRYLLIIDHSAPITHFLAKWPKSGELAVQAEFFEPVWPQFKQVLLSMDRGEVSRETREKLTDVLGVYYHQWPFQEKKLLELQEVALRFGFYRFMEGVGIGGDFLRVTASMRTADIGSERRKKSSENSRVIFNRKATWIVRRLPEITEPSTIFKAFDEQRERQLNVSFYRSKLRGKQFLSIGAVLVGLLDTSYDCSLHITLKIGGKSVVRVARRRLNHVQNTLGIPVFCAMEELSMEDGRGLEFEVKMLVREDVNDHLPGFYHEMPGMNDVMLRMEGKGIAVNKYYLGHHAEFFRTMFFNENFGEHKKEIIDLKSADYEETLQFLDALYHGTKVFEDSSYSKVLRKADEWICDNVVGIVEKAIINCANPTIEKERLASEFALPKLSEHLKELERIRNLPLEPPVIS